MAADTPSASAQESEMTTCYADSAWYGTVVIEQNVPVARDTFRLRFACPPIARKIVPGQFIMVRLSGHNDPLLGRPLALYDTVPSSGGESEALDVVYLVTGKFTRRLAGLKPGHELDVWGPLGNGFACERVEHLVLVAGGIGQTPFLAVAQEQLGLRTYGHPRRPALRARRVTLCYGARTADLLAGIPDFEAAGVEVHLSTDDGTKGHRGLVTDVVARILEHDSGNCHVLACGPEAMLAAVARLTRDRRVPCHVSLETPMACGIGICFSCVAKVRDSTGGWDYRRTCVEGPIFEAERIVF